MSTRANIIRENGDGSFDLIYTHWDGYPSHHGPILMKHYNTPERVDELLKLGDLSVLGREIGEKHDFDWSIKAYQAGENRSEDPRDRMCNAYGRDRGEKDAGMMHLVDVAALEAYLENSWIEWVYVWNERQRKWYFTNNPSPVWFKCCGTEQRATAELTEEAIAGMEA